MGPEAKFYNYFKKNTPNISYTRIENTSALGTPDVLAYNKNNTFFTIEFKVTKSKKVRFSPHQIAFHVEREDCPCFILVKRFSEKEPKKSEVLLYEAGKIREISEQGTRIKPVFALSYPHNWKELENFLDKSVNNA